MSITSDYEHPTDGYPIYGESAATDQEQRITDQEYAAADELTRSVDDFMDRVGYRQYAKQRDTENGDLIEATTVIPVQRWTHEGREVITHGEPLALTRTQAVVDGARQSDYYYDIMTVAPDHHGATYATSWTTNGGKQPTEAVSDSKSLRGGAWEEEGVLPVGDVKDLAQRLKGEHPNESLVPFDPMTQEVRRRKDGGTEIVAKPAPAERQTHERAAKDLGGVTLRRFEKATYEGTHRRPEPGRHRDPENRRRSRKYDGRHRHPEDR